ncbi:MAG: DUF883 family protein [Gammaproteobacteria bacterium]|nr:DUF883 family protein [Gammaproteobacteria bacterium]MBU2435564.1 DUF883 family protein [Gammaproteobacteria bacterium]MBU2449656.1 DUF883 family protein [Gammaproteobacteria bacterium]
MKTEQSTVPGSTEGLKETLARDLKGIVGKADHLLKDAGHTVAEEYSATRHAIAQNACGAANATDAYVRANPWKIIGIAAAAGAFIGALISRR